MPVISAFFIISILVQNVIFKNSRSIFIIQRYFNRYLSGSEVQKLFSISIILAFFFSAKQKELCRLKTHTAQRVLLFLSFSEWMYSSVGYGTVIAGVIEMPFLLTSRSILNGCIFCLLSSAPVGTSPAAIFPFQPVLVPVGKLPATHRTNLGAYRFPVLRLRVGVVPP